MFHGASKMQKLLSFFVLIFLGGPIGSYSPGLGFFTWRYWKHGAVATVEKVCCKTLDDEAFFAECLSADGVEAFFRQCPATELTDVEVQLLNSLISVSEAVQAALSKGVSLQEWAEKRIPNGFEEQVNRSSLVYVGPSRADTPRMPSAQTAKPSAAPCVAAPPVKKVVRLKLQAQATTAMQHSSGNAERPGDHS